MSKTQQKPTDWSHIYAGYPVEFVSRHGISYNFIRLGKNVHDDPHYHDFFSEAVPRLGNAYRIGSNSKDPSTQLGAIIYSPEGKIHGWGKNSFPSGIMESEERYANREVKYKLVQHAERKAICDCAYHGKYTCDTVMYCPWFSCHECAKSVIDSGIKCIIGHYEFMMKSAEINHGDWQESMQLAYDMFRESDKISFYMYKGPIFINEGFKVLVHGEEFNPGDK